jgi:sugar phosphate permease
LNVIVFGGLVVSGALGLVGVFQGLFFVLGIGTGLSAAAMLTAVIEFTTMTHAGLYMGVWGIAHELGQAFGSLLAGGMGDVVNGLTNGNALVAYGTVFGAEGAALLAAIYLVPKVKITSADPPAQGDLNIRKGVSIGAGMEV